MPASLEQEVREFVNFAETGQDPRTGRPVPGAHAVQLLSERQHPDASEALIGVWKTPGGLKSFSQAQDDPRERISRDRARPQKIIDSSDAYGMIETPAGPMRWIKVDTVTKSNKHT